MKKVFLFLLVFMPSLASSQTFIKMNNFNYMAQIPKDLCLFNHKYFFDSNEIIAIKIYDEKYDLVKEFNNLSFLPKYNYIYKTERKDYESGNWILESEVSEERPLYWTYFYENYNGQSFYGCPVSQTLFSDDEKFEFYVPIDFDIQYPISESGSDRYYFTKIQCSGINVISEDGVVLATFIAEGFKFTGQIEFRRVDDIIYAIFSTNDTDNPYAIYKVDKEWSSASNPAKAYKVGDVNNDGKVNVADHVRLSDIIMNQKE